MNYRSRFAAIAVVMLSLSFATNAQRAPAPSDEPSPEVRDATANAHLADIRATVDWCRVYALEFQASAKKWDAHAEPRVDSLIAVLRKYQAATSQPSDPEQIKQARKALDKAVEEYRAHEDMVNLSGETSKALEELQYRLIDSFKALKKLGSSIPEDMLTDTDWAEVFLQANSLRSTVAELLDDDLGRRLIAFHDEEEFRAAVKEIAELEPRQEEAAAKVEELKKQLSKEKDAGKKTDLESDLIAAKNELQPLDDELARLKTRNDERTTNLLNSYVFEYRLPYYIARLRTVVRRLHELRQDPAIAREKSDSAELRIECGPFLEDATEPPSDLTGTSLDLIVVNMEARGEVDDPDALIARVSQYLAGAKKIGRLSVWFGEDSGVYPTSIKALTELKNVEVLEIIGGGGDLKLTPEIFAELAAAKCQTLSLFAASLDDAQLGLLGQLKKLPSLQLDLDGEFNPASAIAAASALPNLTSLSLDTYTGKFSCDSIATLVKCKRLRGFMAHGSTVLDWRTFYRPARLRIWLFEVPEFARKTLRASRRARPCVKSNSLAVSI